MGGEQKGRIQIFARNIRGNANGGILEESKFTKNVAGGRTGAKRMEWWCKS